MKNIKILTLFIPILVSVSADAGKFIRCDYVHNQSAQEILQGVIGNAEVIRPKEDSMHLMFGFESEYTLATTAKLLRVYVPREEFGITESEWHSKTDEQRIAWVAEFIKGKPVGDRDSGLELTEASPELGFMPEKLIRDDTGNLEIVLDPVDSYKDFTHEVALINKTFGLGSMQSMISTSRQNFFKNGDPATVEGRIGFYTFKADMDALQKLQAGAERYMKDESKEVARSFVHPWLGPMSELKQSKLIELLRKNAQGESFDKESLATLSGIASSSKYIGSSAYRPDIGGSQRVSTEVRDAHISQDLLIEKTEQMIYAFRFGTEPFGKFSAIKSFDSKFHYEKLSNKVRFMLEKLFPAMGRGNSAYNAEELFALELYRNFGYPLRDWMPYLENLGKVQYSNQVYTAQLQFVSKLEQIAHDLERGLITEEQASRKAQGALALFSVESGLADIFEHEFDKILDWHVKHEKKN